VAADGDPNYHHSRVPSRLWAVLIVLALGLVPVAPPEHVHETTEADGHHESIAHRHAEVHWIDVSRSDGGTTVDHPDSVIVTVDGVYTTPDPQVVAMPAIAPALLLIAAPDATAARARPAFEPLIHAPPRAPSSPRAPPVSSRL